MFIEKIRLHKYKSFEDSDYIDITEPFTILVGKNNVGKTAFIEAIHRCLYEPQYKKMNDIQLRDTNSKEYEQDPAVLEFIIQTTEEDDWFSDNNNEKIYCQIKFGTFSFHCNIGIYKDGKTFTLQKGDYADSNRITFENDYGNIDKFKVKSINYCDVVIHFLRESFMFISSARRIRGQQKINDDVHLLHDGSNLHAVLHTLLSNKRDIFLLIESKFKLIFPEVREINPSNLPNTETNINLYFDCVDYPIPIQHCGSGYTSVLLFLTVLLSEVNKVILFDEPHLYLHPSAEKAIYDIAKELHNHKYIFATHSPILINYPIDKNMYLVTKESGKSKFDQLHNVNTLFDEIGLNNSDFALSEKVIFVEGETEEKVLPMILNHFGMKQIGYNYRIINYNGGDRVAYKELKKNCALYETILTQLSSSPIPYTIMIDRDEKDEEMIHKLKELYGVKLIILDRREIENYLLIPEAIYSALQGIQIEGEGIVQPCLEEISELIRTSLEKTDDRDLYRKGCKDPIIDIKASKVLEVIFQKYHVDYSKPKHGKLIVEWILQHQPEELKEIVDYIGCFLGRR